MGKTLNVAYVSQPTSISLRRPNERFVSTNDGNIRIIRLNIAVLALNKNVIINWLF